MTQAWFPINRSPIGYEFTYRDFFQIRNGNLYVRLRLPCGAINEKASSPEWVDEVYGEDLADFYDDYNTLNTIATGLMHENDIPWITLKDTSINDMDIAELPPA